MNERLVLNNIYEEELYLVRAPVTIVLTTAWSNLAPAEKDLLSKITEALRQRINPKLGLHSFRVVHMPTFDLSAWPEKPEKFIYFGPPVKGFAPYEVISTGSTKVVFADPLAGLIGNETDRTRLWQVLKQLFS